ncbi:hypothetical protein FJZ22_00045 [Candidatus Pacearchaeota archaeon]|nr:hypothetical protein [Candidatus Pacearchaeota archaeon]
MNIVPKNKQRALVINRLATRGLIEWLVDLWATLEAFFKEIKDIKIGLKNLIVNKIRCKENKTFL